MPLPSDVLGPVPTDVLVVLPAPQVRASATPDAVEVRRVFPAAIELSDMLSFTRGYFAMGGSIFLIGSLLLLASTTFDHFFRLREPSVIYLVIMWLLCAPAVGVTYFLFRADTTGFRYEPVLFCRGGAEPTVHHFAAAGVSLIPFKPVKAQIRSFPWSCVRAEISTFVVGATPFAGRQNMLRLCITESPGSNRVVERFNVGLVDVGDGSQIVNLWEHIRRYMEEGGPPLTGQGTEKLVPAERMPLWQALLSFMPVGPDASMWGRFAWWKLLAAPFVLIAFPLTAFFGLFRWLSLALKKTPQWPPEILNAAGGGPLSREEVARVLERNQVGARRRPVFRLNGQIVDSD